MHWNLVESAFGPLQILFGLVFRWIFFGLGKLYWNLNEVERINCRKFISIGWLKYCTLKQIWNINFFMIYYSHKMYLYINADPQPRTAFSVKTSYEFQILNSSCPHDPSCPVSPYAYLPGSNRYESKVSGEDMRQTLLLLSICIRESFKFLWTVELHMHIEIIEGRKARGSSLVCLHNLRDAMVLDLYLQIWNWFVVVFYDHSTTYRFSERLGGLGSVMQW